MSVISGKGPVYESGLCRCCGSSKKCRLLNHEYEWMGQKEIYSDMFVDCFGLLLSHLEATPEERLVCATCVVRLRDACAFRRQVLCCEEALLKKAIRVEDNMVEIKVENDVKDESQIEVDQLNDNDHFDTAAAAENTDSDYKEEYKPKKKIKKTTKKGKKLKSGVKRKKTNKTEDGLSKREQKEILTKLKKMATNLKKMENVYEVPDASQTRKSNDDEHKLSNTVIIIKNSYVCPFDTSFSDYYCFYCRNVFTDPTKLREHTLTHDPETFLESATNKKHVQVDITRVDCRLCTENINNIDELKRHLIRIHNKDIRLDLTNEFLKFKLTLNGLTCIECGSTFSFFHALKKHMAEHFGTFICDMCGAHYFQERMLVLHQKTHEKKTDSIYSCRECGKTFKSKQSMNLHVSKTHTKEATYQCSKCDSVFFSYSLRYRHMIDTHGEERSFQCELCDRTYDSRKSLREHNRRHHLKIFKHQCDLCDKRFYLPSRLREHMVVHTGERNYRCDYCGKSYPRLRGLRVHMQSHGTEKKYKCGVCNACFTQNVNLKNHMKRQHQSLDADESFQE